MTDKMRIGLIGCGSQGRYLSEAAGLSGEAELVACADPKEEAAQATAELCGYRETYADAHEMLATADMDAVIVATIHDQLQPMALAAVQAGKHVLVEKPMALNAADGQALVDAAKHAGVNLMVGYTLRYAPARIKMKDLLDQGAVGDMAHIIAGQIIGSMGGWLGDKAHGGGPVFYVGTHVIDQVMWVADRPAERVYAEVNWKEQGGVEADAMLTIRFERGLVAHVSTSQRMGGRYGWLDVIGSAGRIRAEWESHQLYVESRQLAPYAHPTLIELPAMAGHPPYLPSATARISGFRYVRDWGAEIMEFITSIREGRSPAVPGEHGVRVLQICDAVFESARTGTPVDLRR